jgi:hypothetical protein
MATVRLTDIIEPEVFSDYTAVDSTTKTALFTSGIIVTNSLLQAKANTGGSTIQVPFWNDLDEGEPNISSDNPADVATATKITAGKQTASIAYLNKGFSASDLATEIAGSDPMERVAGRLSAHWDKVLQKRIIASLVGVIADNVANDAGDMVVDVAIETGTTATAANKFNRDSFVDASFTLGDNADTLRGVGVHSVVYSTMVKNDDIEFIPDSQGSLTVPTYLGKVVIQDDGMPVVAAATNGFKYTSFLFGQGLIGFGEGTPEVPVAVEREESQGNGGGIETLWSRKTYLIHPFGFQFTEASVAGETATLTELNNAANWDRVVSRKNVPFAALITNG